MLQKLGLAGCLLARRPLTVLDEPMSGLDPLARSRVRATLASLGNGGGTLLFSSHSLEDVEALCDRMAVIHDGRVAFAGTPAELSARFDTTPLEQAFLRCIGVAAA
jgi:ABC-2 type transport system ATP-binding protein